MSHLINNKKISKRRGISSVVGTLIMVAIVAALGSTILFQGLNGINDFNYYLSFLTGSKKSLQENLMIEHVRFNPTDEQLDIWIRNTGTVQVEIAKITMVKIDSQELVPIDISGETTISIGDIENMNGLADLTVLVIPATQWDDPSYATSEYRISVTTAMGNSFESTATPFNT